MCFRAAWARSDELFELLALRQTDKGAANSDRSLRPEIHGEEVINFDAMAKHGVISKPDESLFTFAETPEQAWEQCVDGGVLTRWLQEQHTT